MFNPDICAKCEYSGQLDSTYFCDYLNKVGHMRGCYDGKVCKKFSKKLTFRRKKIVFGEGVNIYERE